MRSNNIVINVFHLSKKPGFGVWRWVVLALIFCAYHALASDIEFGTGYLPVPNPAYGGSALLPALPNTGMDVSQHLQNAIDRCAASGGGTVYIESNVSWTLASPVFVNGSNIKIVGKGGKATFLPPYDKFANNLFVVGYPRDPKNGEHGLINTLLDGGQDPNGHFPSFANGVGLDSSCGPTFGARTNDSTYHTKAFGYSASNPFAYGGWCGRDSNTNNYWQPPLKGDTAGQPSVRHYRPDWANYKLTLEVAFQNNSAGTLVGNILGVGAPTEGHDNDMSDRSMIFKLAAATDGVKFSFNSFSYNSRLDTNGSDFITRTLTIKPITDNIMHRVVIQFDLHNLTGTGTNSCTMWMDEGGVGKYATVALDGGTLLNEYKYGAFRLGDVTYSSLRGNPAGMDLTYRGLKLSSTLRYTNNSTLTCLSEADGGYPIRLPDTFVKDYYRYLWAANDDLGYSTTNNYDRYCGALIDFRGNNTPPTAFKTMLKYSNGYNKIGHFFWLVDKPSTPVGNIEFRRIRALQCGTAFLLGDLTSVKFYDVYTSSCVSNCIASMEGPSYTAVTLNSVDFDGAGDAGYAGNNQHLEATRMMANCGRNEMRFHGVNGTVRGLMLNDPNGGIPFYMFMAYAGKNGGMLTFASCDIDTEGASTIPTPSKANFYIEASPNPVVRNGLTLENISPGMMTSTMAWVEIKDNAAAIASPGVLTIEGLRVSIATQGKMVDCIVRTDAPKSNWSGVVNGAFPTIPVRRWISYTNSTGQCGIIVKHPVSSMSAAPSTGPAPSVFAGFQFTLKSPLTISELSRWCYAGDSGTHRLLLIDNSATPNVLREASVTMNPGIYAGKFQPGSAIDPITLNPGRYSILSSEFNTSKDTYGYYLTDTGDPALVTISAADARVNWAVWCYPLDPTNPASNPCYPEPNYAPDGSSFGPVNFSYGGIPFITHAVLGSARDAGEWVEGCDLFTIIHPGENGIAEYKCIKNGNPGEWAAIQVN